LILFQLPPTHKKTSQDTEGKTHILSASASTKKPDEIKTEDNPADEPPKAMEGVTEASAPAGDGEKTTPTPAATPSTQPGPSSVAAATGQEEQVKTKPAEKKTEVSRILHFFEKISSISSRFPV
jgi:hypothetical protein